MKKWLKELNSSYYTIGFVRGGKDALMIPKTKIEADFIKWDKVDNEGSWFADPFVLDVSDDVIDVLVEEMPKHVHKGIITKLSIDRKTFSVLRKKVVLELPHHLSFPDVLRRNGKVFICPENGKSGPLALYEYDPQEEIAVFKCNICNDKCWDSAVTNLFGDDYLFTATKDDNCLDIYKWNPLENTFIAYQKLFSLKKDCRLAGEPFEYKNSFYYPAQLCDKYYGRGVVIKEIQFIDGEFSAHPVLTLFSPHKKLRLGMHTLNEYKGVVVIDVRGSRHRIVGPIIYRLGAFILRIQGKTW